MKLGDLILNLDIKAINEQIKNASPKELSRVKAKSLAIAASADLIIEILEAPTIDKLDFDTAEMIPFTIEVLAGIAFSCVLRFAKRTDKPEDYLTCYRQVFDQMFDRFKGLLK